MKMNIANAPCSWGALEFDLHGDGPRCTAVLDEMAACGYTGTELGDWGFMPTDPHALAEELHSRRLALVGAFVPVDFKERAAHPAGIETALKTARLMSAVEGSLPFIILADENGKDPLRTANAGRVSPEMGLSLAQWKVFAEGVERTARAVREETGLRTVFHHHCAGFVETPQEVDHLMEYTDPDLVGLCLDSGHYCFGGGDPLDCLQRYGSRVWHFHFKDFSAGVAAAARKQGWDYFHAVAAGVFCELGQGAVDFPALMQALDGLEYNGWGTVEQDVLPGMGSPQASARRNLDYIETVLSGRIQVKAAALSR